MDTSMGLAFNIMLDRQAMSAEQFKNQLSKTEPELRLERTLDAIKKLLKNSEIWEDPGYPWFRILGQFSKILRENYYSDKTRHFQNRMMKKLSYFDNKKSVYTIIFSWYDRLLTKHEA